MKIRLNELTPYGEVVRGERIIESDSSLGIVKELMLGNPFSSGKSELDYMRETLARIGENSDLPNSPADAADYFISCLLAHKLAVIAL